MPQRRATLSVLSGFTLLFAVAVTAFAALVTTLVSLEILGPDATEVLVLAGPPTAVLAASAVTVVMSLLMGHPLQRVAWALMAAGMFVTGVAGALRAYHSLVLGRPLEYPGPAEAIFLVGYLTMAASMFVAAVRHRGRTDYTLPMAEAAGLTATLGVGVWVMALSPLRLTSALHGDVLTDVAYVTADLILLVGPALFLVLAAARVSETPVVIPASLLLLGLFAMSVGDFMRLTEHTGVNWSPGSMADFCWMAGPAFIAVAASSVIDIQRDTARSTRREA